MATSDELFKTALALKEWNDKIIISSTPSKTDNEFNKLIRDAKKKQC